MSRFDVAKTDHSNTYSEIENMCLWGVTIYTGAIWYTPDNVRYYRSVVAKIKLELLTTLLTRMYVNERHRDTTTVPTFYNGAVMNAIVIDNMYE